MTSRQACAGLPPLRWPFLGFVRREALSLMLAPLLAVAGSALWLHFGVGFLERARLSEALFMMGHARREIALEHAQRPGWRAPGPGDPVALATLKTADSMKRRSLRYVREGDRVVAHFQVPGTPGQQAVWVLSLVESPEVSPWVMNWRCTSRSTGRWRQIARGVCPDESSLSP